MFTCSRLYLSRRKFSRGPSLLQSMSCYLCRKKLWRNGVQISRLKTICDQCSWKRENAYQRLLEAENHRCLRNLDLHAYPYVQWCGNQTCRKRETKSSFNPNEIYILKDIDLNSDRLVAMKRKKSCRLVHLVVLTQMSFENWLQLDNSQRFYTFKQAIQGYMCSICWIQSSETNPIFTHFPCRGLSLCTSCVIMAKENLKYHRNVFSLSNIVKMHGPPRSTMTKENLKYSCGVFSLSSIVEMYRSLFLIRIFMQIQIPPVLSNIVFTYATLNEDL